MVAAARVERWQEQRRKRVTSVKSRGVRAVVPRAAVETTGTARRCRRRRRGRASAARVIPAAVVVGDGSVCGGCGDGRGGD